MSNTIDPATWPGHVALTVADLPRQLKFYQNILGFKLHGQDGATARLGAGGPDLLHLIELPGARRVRGTTGLYHVAFLLPTRWDLAHLVNRIAETNTPVQGASDHKTHLALYLPDAEGNGLELAWDFPQAQWPMSNGKLRFDGGPHPLDFDALFAALKDGPRAWPGLPPETKVGHVHLHVADFRATYRFYHEVLGMDVTIADEARMGAIFVSAGGYHHHIGLNLWQGVGAPPPPADAQGLSYYTLNLPNPTALEETLARLSEAGERVEPFEGGWATKDPAQNKLVLKVNG